MPIDLAVLAGLIIKPQPRSKWPLFNGRVKLFTVGAFIEDRETPALHSVFDRGEFIAGWHWLLRGNIGVDIPVDSQEGIRDNLLRRPDTAPAVSG